MAREAQRSRSVRRCRAHQGAGVSTPKCRRDGRSPRGLEDETPATPAWTLRLSNRPAEPSGILDSLAGRVIDSGPPWLLASTVERARRRSLLPRGLSTMRLRRSILSLGLGCALLVGLGAWTM